jgi:hypothetical protein
MPKWNKKTIKKFRYKTAHKFRTELCENDFLKNTKKLNDKSFINFIDLITNSPKKDYNRESI